MSDVLMQYAGYSGYTWALHRSLLHSLSLLISVQGSTGVRFEDVAGIDEVVNELQEVSGMVL